MSKTKIISILFVLGILVLASQLFIPNKYDVELFKERKGTQYWNLKTGSKIGFTKIERSNIVQLVQRKK